MKKSAGQEWYFSVVDVVAVLTEQETPRGASTYWGILNKRLKEEGNELQAPKFNFFGNRIIYFLVVIRVISCY
jgi:hypothetical protein